MIKKLLIGLVCIHQLCYAAADEKLSPQDFAYGMAIELKDNASVQRITLPLAVYQKLTSDNLSDIRIFNSQNDVVNSTIISPAINQQKQTQPLQFFPIYSDKATAKSINLEFTRAEDGSVIVKQPRANKGEKPLIGYLIDTRAVKNKAVQELLLTWDQTNDTWIRQVTLSASEDLIHWTDLSHNNSLAQLKHNTDSIIKNTLTIREIPYSYLLIKADEPLTINVKTVAATIVKQQMDQYRWSAINQLTYNELPNEYEFTTPHSLPVSALQIDFIDKNILEEVTISSRANDKQPWHVKAVVPIYKINLANQQIENHIIRFAPTRDTLWQLKTTNQKTSPFSVQIGWIPENIYFVTTGNPPFTLAYGSGKANVKSPDSFKIMQEFTTQLKADTATLGKPFSLGGEKALKVPSKPINYQTLLLWAILLCGVLVVGKMAFSLLKQLKNQPH